MSFGIRKLNSSSFMTACLLVAINFHWFDSCYAQSGSKDFYNLYDDYLIAQSLLSDPYSFTYAISDQSTAERIALGASRTESRFQEEVGVLAVDSSEGSRFQSTRVSSTTVTEVDEEESVLEHLLYSHALSKGNLNLNMICESTIQGTGIVRDANTEVNSGFSSLHIELLPFCSYYDLKHGGGFSRSFVDTWKASEVISDEINSKGEREIFVVLPRRHSGAKIVLVEREHWRAKEVEFLGSVDKKLDKQEIYPDEFIKKNWRQFCHLFLEWDTRVVDSEDRYFPVMVKLDYRNAIGRSQVQLHVRTGGWKFGKEVKELDIGAKEFERICKEEIDFDTLRRKLQERKLDEVAR